MWSRTDTGCFLLAETLGVRGMVYVKDEDGLYTDDPKKNTKADFIPKISVNELLSMKLPDFVVEPQVLKFMTMAVHVRRIQIVNGLKKGNLTKALNGEDVGTVIYA